MKQKWAEGEIELRCRFNEVLADPVKSSGSVAPSELHITGNCPSSPTSVTIAMLHNKCMTLGDVLDRKLTAMLSSASLF